MIPLLPVHLLSYTSAPVPYVIGLKKEFLRNVNMEALGDVIIVDLDVGECQAIGDTETISILEESGSVMKHASQQFGKVVAKVWDWGSKYNGIDIDTNEKHKMGIAAVGFLFSSSI